MTNIGIFQLTHGGLLYLQMSNTGHTFETHFLLKDWVHTCGKFQSRFALSQNHEGFLNFTGGGF